MSFILDALKKSETDRQQKVSPGIADVPTASGRPANARWMPVVIALLAVNLAAVLYVLLRPGAPEPEVLVATPAANRPAADAQSLPPLPAPQPVAAAETRLPDTGRNTRPAAPVPESATAAASEEPAVRAAPPAPARQPQAESSSEDETAWLTLNDLRASGKLDLPEMHIDLHVYSPNPAERFVFVNMQEYRENATMAEGPRVRRITSEGVLLDYRGSTFLLPRD